MDNVTLTSALDILRALEARLLRSEAIKRAESQQSGLSKLAHADAEGMRRAYGYAAVDVRAAVARLLLANTDA